MNIDKTTAKKLFEEVPWLQEQLIEEFGKETFEKKDFESLLEFNLCCIKCGTTEEDFNKKFKPLNLDPDTFAYEQLKIIYQAGNMIDGKTWIADYSNPKEEKFEPVFILSSGCVFSLSHSDYSRTYSGAGSRLSSRNGEISDFFAQQFIHIWEVFLTRKS
jgi:hypothetical protein